MQTTVKVKTRLGHESPLPIMKVQGLGFKVLDLGFTVYGLRFRV